MDIKRRCHWAAVPADGPDRIVWARGPVATNACPKSLITADSIGWIEQFLAWKRLGMTLDLSTSARQVEAFLILEEQISGERQSATG